MKHNALEKKVAAEIKGLLGSNPTDADFLLAAQAAISSVNFHNFMTGVAKRRKEPA